MSKVFQQFRHPKDTTPATEKECEMIAKEAGILDYKGVNELVAIGDITPPEYHFKDYILKPFDLPIFDEKRANEILNYDRQQREKHVYDSLAVKHCTPKDMPKKGDRSGPALLKYFLAVSKEFASYLGTPYFYNVNNGAWYPLTTIDGRRMFLSSLEEQEQLQLDYDSVDKLADAILSNKNIPAMDFKSASPNLINFMDAVYDVREEQVLSHNSSYKFTYCLNATTTMIADDYHGGELLENYLQKSFDGNQEKIDTLGEIFGVSISSIRNQKQMFFLYGPSSCGKSVAINILHGLFCDEFVTDLGFEQLSGKFELSELCGSHLNLASEISCIKGKSAIVVKRITGNDVVYGDRKGKNGIKMLSHALLLFATNILPRVKDDDEAYYSRFRVLRYDHSIPQSEWIKGIEDGILNDEKGFLLRFAIEGLKRYLANDMEISTKEESDSYVYDYQAPEDSFTDFINQFIVVSDDGILLNSELYEAYYDYCDRNRLDKVKGDRTCHQTLVARFNAKPDRFGKNRDRGFRGIKLCYNTDNAYL